MVSGEDLFFKLGLNDLPWRGVFSTVAPQCSVSVDVWNHRLFLQLTEERGALKWDVQRAIRATGEDGRITYLPCEPNGLATLPLDSDLAQEWIAQARAYHEAVSG